MSYWPRQCGNALTEFFIVTLVMVPALFALPLLGKITDANLSAVQASRYVAFEKTVSGKSDEVLQTEVSNRFFADPNLTLSTGNSLQSESVNSFWGITNAEGEADALLNPDSKLTLAVKNQSVSNDAVAAISSGIVSAGNVLADVIPGAEWNLEKKGLYIATVTTAMKQPAGISVVKNCGDDNQPLACIARKTAIFVDGWNADSAAQAEDRSRAMVPAGVFRPVGNGLAVIGEFPLLEEMKGLKNAFGKVDSEQVPADRLGPWEDQQ